MDDTALFFHIHHTDVLRYYLDIIFSRGINNCKHCFVSVTEEAIDLITKEDMLSLKSLRGVEIQTVRNMGCDQYGLLKNINRAKEKEFQKCIVLHTKKSNINFQRKGNWVWLTTRCFLDKPLFERLVGVLEHPDVGIVGSQGIVHKACNPTEPWFAELRSRYNKTYEVDVHPYHFYAGFMFACKREILEKCMSIVKEEDFNEGYVAEGAVQHGLERFIPSAFHAEGMRVELVWV